MRIRSIKATSIAEAMVVMLIIVTWVTWMYKIYSESIKLSNSTANKIQAIQIAKQWIEAITNIRDTNWLLFSSDYKNCWNTLNYNAWCIWESSPVLFEHNEKYKIFSDSNNRWVMEAPWLAINPEEYSNPDYRDFFRVWLNNWIYSQSWSLTNLLPIFTREIKIEYIDTNWNSTPDNKDEKIKVTALVQWKDNASTNPHKVELNQVLTNWKK